MGFLSKIAIVVSLAILSGCATAGKEVKTEQLSGFKKGETTVEQVVAALGNPTTDITASTGERIMGYSYSHVQARPESFIPYVGLLVGGADAKMSTVSFVFGKDGKMQSYQSSQTTTDAKTGLSALK